MIRPSLALLFLLAGLTAAFPARAQDDDPDAPRRALHDEIVAANDSMAAAFNRGDMDRVVDFFAEDAVILGVGGPELRGRAAIAEAYAGVENRAWDLDVLSVGGGADLAYQVGKLHVTRTAGENAGGGYTIDFVAIWKRDDDGRLRILMDLF